MMPTKRRFRFLARELVTDGVTRKLCYAEGEGTVCKTGDKVTVNIGKNSRLSIRPFDMEKAGFEYVGHLRIIRCDPRGANGN